MAISRTTPASQRTQSAIVLTEDEWADLVYVAKHYVMGTNWVEGRTDDTDHLDGVRRRRALCERVIEAVD